MLLLHKVNISLFLASILMGYTTFLEKEKTMYIIMDDMIKKVRRLKRYNYMEKYENIVWLVYIFQTAYAII